MAAPTKTPPGGAGRWALPGGAVASPRIELPSNTTPATARVMTPLPYGEVCNIHFATPTLYEVWYRLNAIAGQYAIGFQASPEALSDYSPVVKIYTGSPTSLTAYQIDDQAGAIQIAATPGTSYFFRVRNTGPAIVIGTLTISTRLALNSYVPPTGLLINNDVSGHPLTGLSGTGAGALQTRPFPAGESACMLPSGISLWEDGDDGEHLFLYDATLTLIATPAWTRYGSVPQISSNGVDTFYVSDDRADTGAYLRTVSETGVMGATWVLPDADHTIYALSVSPDETIAYYRTAALGDGPLQRFDLTTSTALTDLAAPIVGAQNAGELLTLSDGTVLVGYKVTGIDYVAHLAADGTTLDTYPMPGADMQINRLSRALTEASFWVWCWGTGPDAGIDTFVQIRVSDGVYLENFTSPQYSGGVFMGPIESTEVPFGHPLSCPMVPPPPPGLPPYGGPPDAVEDFPPMVAPSYALDARAIRRLRRAPHVTQEHARVFYARFQLDLERGQGLATGQGSDPIVLLRISRDGGQTWADEIPMHAGALGAYTQRVLARRLGHARDTVFEVTVSDPIAWSLVGAWLDLEPGTS